MYKFLLQNILSRKRLKGIKSDLVFDIINPHATRAHERIEPRRRRKKEGVTKPKAIVFVWSSSCFYIPHAFFRKNFLQRVLFTVHIYIEERNESFYARENFFIFIYINIGNGVRVHKEEYFILWIKWCFYLYIFFTYLKRRRVMYFNIFFEAGGVKITRASCNKQVVHFFPFLARSLFVPRQEGCNIIILSDFFVTSFMHETKECGFLLFSRTRRAATLMAQ